MFGFFCVEKISTCRVRSDLGIIETEPFSRLPRGEKYTWAERSTIRHVRGKYLALNTKQ